MVEAAGAFNLFTLRFLSVWVSPPPERTFTTSGIGVSRKRAKLAETVPLPVIAALPRKCGLH